MAYDLLFFGDGQQVIRTPSGRTILRREDGTWMLAEDRLPPRLSRILELRLTARRATRTYRR